MHVTFVILLLIPMILVLIYMTLKSMLIHRIRKCIPSPASYKVLRLPKRIGRNSGPNSSANIKIIILCVCCLNFYVALFKNIVNNAIHVPKVSGFEDRQGAVWKSEYHKSTVQICSSLLSTFCKNCLKM